MVAIFTGLGRAYRLVEGLDFEVIKWGASHKGMGPILWGKLTPQDTPKGFNLAILGGLGWMKWLKNGAGKCLNFL